MYQNGYNVTLQMRKHLDALEPEARFTSEIDARQVFKRLSGCWTYWGWKNGYFDAEKDALAYHEEMLYTLASQAGAPNSPHSGSTQVYIGPMA